MQLSPDEQKLLLLQIVEQIAKKIVVQQTKGINRCMLSEKKESRDGRPLTLYTLITEGSNIEAMHSHGHVLDLNRIVCNDIARVLTTYGVEAGRYVSLHLAVLTANAWASGCCWARLSDNSAARTLCKRSRTCSASTRTTSSMSTLSC